MVRHNLVVIDMDTGAVLATKLTRRQKWWPIVMEGVAMIKSFSDNADHTLMPQGEMDFNSNLPNVYGVGSKTWITARSGRYQLKLEEVKKE